MSEVTEPPERADAEPPRVRARHLALGLVGAAVVGAVVVAGIGRLAGFAELREVVQGADWPWLVVCVLGQCLVFVGYGGVFRRTVASEHGARISVATSLAVVFASFAATQLFAFAGAGGLAVVYWALRRAGMDRSESAVLLIGLNTAVYLVFGVIGWTAALWCLLAGVAPLGMTLPWLLGFPLVLAAARWFTAPSRVERWTAAGSSWWRRALAIGVGAAAWVRRALLQRRGRPIFGWALCYWVGDIASLWAALHAVGARPAVAALPLVYATGYLVQSLPIPLVATGGVDAATVFLLHALGVPLELGLAGVAIHRVFAFWLPVVPGVVLALLLPRTGRSLAEAAA